MLDNNILDNKILEQVIKSWTFAKDKIRCRLVNTMKNQKMLEDHPHKDFLDMSIVFYIDFGEYNGMKHTVLIDTDMMNAWIKTTSDLYAAAVSNDAGKNFMVTGMDTILKDFVDMETVKFPVSMYVFTNSDALYGSAGIVTRLEKIKNFADSCGKDVYILPSSVHEVILIPVENDMFTADEFKDMVMCVNETALSDDEFLSDNVYIYKRDSGNIEIIAA